MYAALRAARLLQVESSECSVHEVVGVVAEPLADDSCHSLASHALPDGADRAARTQPVRPSKVITLSLEEELGIIDSVIHRRSSAESQTVVPDDGLVTIPEQIVQPRQDRAGQQPREDGRSLEGGSDSRLTASEERLLAKAETELVERPSRSKSTLASPLRAAGRPSAAQLDWETPIDGADEMRFDVRLAGPGSSNLSRMQMDDTDQVKVMGHISQ